MPRKIQFFQLIACCILAVSCKQSSSQSTHPLPPASSYRIASVDLVMKGATHTISGAFVTPQFIQGIRDQPLIGRYFTEIEYQESSGRVAVVSQKLWERLGSDYKIIGETVEVNGQPCKVIGVMHKGFTLPTAVDVWLPEAARSRSENPGF
jgi:hypothetical protein